MDKRLAGLARSFGFNYTRYADDMTFSGDDTNAIHKLRPIATRIIRQEGFEIHPDKTRIMRSGNRQTVTGVVVNKDLGLSRKERRRLRAMIHRLEKQMEQRSTDEELLAYLRGKLAYLSMLNPRQAEALRREGSDLY
jgi:retron-type reverse transcriptase